MSDQPTRPSAPNDIAAAEQAAAQQAAAQQARAAEQAASVAQQARAAEQATSVARFLALGGKPYKPPSGKGGFSGWGARAPPEPGDTDADDIAAHQAAVEAHRLRMIRRTEEMVQAEAKAIVAEIYAYGTPSCDRHTLVCAHTMRAY